MRTTSTPTELDHCVYNNETEIKARLTYPKKHFVQYEYNSLICLNNPTRRAWDKSLAQRILPCCSRGQYFVTIFTKSLID